MRTDEVFANLKKRIEQGGVTDETVKKIVEQYFEKNPVQVITDNTLSVAGTPADALATGTAIDSLKEDLVDLDDKTDVGTNKTQIEITLGDKGSVIWNNGDYSATGGGSTYCTEPFSVDGFKKIYISGRFYNKVIGAFYEETSQTSNAVGVIKDVESTSDRTLTDYEVEVPRDAKYCRICTYIYNNASAKYSEEIKIKDYVDSNIQRSVSSAKNELEASDGVLANRIEIVEDKTFYGSKIITVKTTNNKNGIVGNNGAYGTWGGNSQHCSDLIDLSKISSINRKVRISTRVYELNVGAFYKTNDSNENGILIRDVESTSDRTLTDYEVEVPDGYNYIRICSYVKKESTLKYDEDLTFDESVDSKCNTTYNNSISHSKLKGKKVVWFGTSIPAGGVSGNYPKILADRLGFTVYNEAVGSSACRAGCHSNITDSDTLGWIGTTFQNIAYSLSGSLEEKEEIIENYGKYGWNVTLNDIDKEYIRDCSYERKLDRYLSDGSVGQVDLYVFDHGFNDALFHNETVDELETIPTDKYDRTYFIGAMNFLINRILIDNPKAKIVFIQHYQTDWSASSHVVPAQKLLAQYWNFPSLEVWKDIGWTEKTIKSKGSWVNGLWVDNSLSTEKDYSIKNIWIADNLHPHSDLSGKALNHYADILEPFFKDLSLNN